MKVKGITIWEQYAEFIAIGIVAVVFVVYVVFQVSDDTNSVKIGSSTMSPGDVDEELRKKADALNRRISSDAPSPVEFEMPQPQSQRFLDALTASVSPSYRESHPRPMVVVDAGSSVDMSGQSYIEPTVQAADRPVTMQFFDGLDDSAVSGNPELEERFADRPYDTTWITAAAVFDADKVLEQYRSKGANNELPLREKWYNGRLDIVDVVVEREEMVDGRWANLKVVDAIPGQSSFREQIAGEVDSGTRDEIISKLAVPGTQSEIIRPSFLMTRNSDWVHPAMYSSEGDGANEVLVLKRRYSALMQQIDDTTEQIKQLGGGRPGGSGGPGGKPGGSGLGGSGGGGIGGLGGSGGGGIGGLGGSGGGGGGGIGGLGGSGGGIGGLGGSGGGGGGGGAAGSSKREREMRLKRLERDLARYERQLDKASDRLQQLGVAVGDDGELDLGIESSQDEVWTWVHDMDIVAGHQYRYRFTIKVYNPFFAKKLSLISEQHHLADDFALESVTSEWSEPVQVDPFVRYFITRAVPSGYGAASGNLGLGSAEAEVYRFHDGQWHSRTFPVQPGDRIGGARIVEIEAGDKLETGQTGEMGEGEDDGTMLAGDVEIDFGTGLYVLEIIPNATLDPSRVRFGREAVVVLAPLDPSMGTGHVIRDPRGDGDEVKPSEG